jgi:hypothetical protein
MRKPSIENVISKEKNILVVLQEENELVHQFCGRVVHSFSEIRQEQRIYVCGDVTGLPDQFGPLYIIKELSRNYENYPGHHLITLGEVPIIVSNAGVYFRKFFTGDDFFEKIRSEHDFQDLTESNKPGIAFRKGIYLANVTKDDKEVLYYRLLRCSSNLTGPTDNFRATDHQVVNALNEAAKYVFEQETELNHVLAQIYVNKGRTAENNKEVKAKIKAHSDKTKDMPKDALIVFCTFYDKVDLSHLSTPATDQFDKCYKSTTGLTSMLFKLKDTVKDDTLAKEFTVTLYPNSVFMIPLSTNRLYTHETRPSMLNADKIPTRLGYVVRCSNLEAQYVDNQAYILDDDRYIPLEPVTEEAQNELKTAYREENISADVINYGKVNFSMNTGDYERPIL